MTLRTLQIGMGWFTERPGGLNRVYAHLVSELAAMGVETYGLVAGTPDVERASGGLARAFARVDDPLVTRLLGVRRAALPWLGTHDSNAVIVSHFAQHALPLLDAIRRNPFVVHFQGPWGRESRLEGDSLLSMLAKEVVERTVYRRADAAIVLSEAFADILAGRFGVKRDRIHVIPGGVEYSRFATARSRDDCRAALSWPTDRPIVLCVRRLVRRVGVDVLIDAVVEIRRRVPDVLVLIAGRGAMRDELDAKIAALGLGDAVRLLGFVPDELLPVAYRAADLSVVPSTALEGFGLITVESLAAGTPCIVTPVGGLAGIVTPFAPALVAQSTSAAHIAAALSGALLGELALPTSEECAMYARTNFDWPVIARRVRAVYERVA